MNTEETNINTDEYLEELFHECNLNPLQVAAAVTDVTSVPLNKICDGNESSDPKVTNARALAMCLARKCTSHSLLKIAKFFKCTHPLIIFKVKEVGKRLLAEDSLRSQLDLIVARMQDMCE